MVPTDNSEVIVGELEDQKLIEIIAARMHEFSLAIEVGIDEL